MVDFLGHKPCLYTYGKERYTTKFGLILSILTIITLVVISLILSVSFIQKKNLTIVSFDDNRPHIASAELSKEPIFFRVSDLNTGKMVDQKILTVLPFLAEFKNGKYSETELETEQCKLNKHFKDPDLVKNENVENYLCLKDDLSMLFDSKKGYKRYINIFVVKCGTYGKTKPSDCLDRKLIDEDVSMGYYFYDAFYPITTVDHYNKSNPTNKSFFTKKYKLVDGFLTEMMNILVNDRYITDKGLVFEDLDINDGFTIKEDRVSRYPKGNLPFLGVWQLMPTPNLIYTTKRSYEKIQNLMADLGGILKFIITVASFITNFVTEKIFYVDMSNFFISNEDEKKNVAKRLNCSSFVNVNNVEYSNSIKESNKNNLNNFSFRAKTKKIKKKKTLKTISVLLPCVKAYKNLNVNVFKELIRKKVSTEEILKVDADFDNFKYLMLDDNEMVLFDYMKYKTVSQHQEFKSELKPSEMINIVGTGKVYGRLLNRNIYYS